MAGRVVKKTARKNISRVRHIPAGFASPASDLVQDSVDLNELLVERPAATYYVEVQGHSMTGAGIFSGDTLIVDRSIDPKHNAIVVAVIDGEFTVKRVQFSNSDQITLVAENPKYPSIRVEEGMDVQLWGVVKWVLHRV